jgi:hypothetical protein
MSAVAVGSTRAIPRAQSRLQFAGGEPGVRLQKVGGMLRRQVARRDHFPQLTVFGSDSGSVPSLTDDDGVGGPTGRFVPVDVYNFYERQAHAIRDDLSA